MNLLRSSFDSLSLPTLVENLGWLLVHSVWQFALIGLVAVVGLRLIPQRKAAARYWLLIATLGASVLTPGLTWLVLPNQSGLTVAVEAVGRLDDDDSPFEPTPYPTGHTPATPPRGSAGPIVPIVDRVEAPIATGAVTTTPTAKSIISLSEANAHIGVTQQTPTSSRAVTLESVRPWFPAIVGTWLIGVLIFSLRPLFGWWTVWRLQSVGISPVPESVQHLFAATVVRLRVTSAVRVFESSLVAVPVVVGYLKPMVLLPASVVTGLPASQLEAILAHELAHVRRFDYAINVLQTLIETVYFYHPAIWRLSRQIRIEREHCCDDAAIAALDNRSEYGRALLAVAAFQGSTPLAAVGMRGSSLQVRIRRLCGVEPARGSWASFAVFLILAVTGVAATALAWQPPDNSDVTDLPIAAAKPTPAAGGATGNALRLVGSNGSPLRRAVGVREASLGYPGENANLRSWSTDPTGFVTLTGLADGTHYLVANPTDVNPTLVTLETPLAVQPRLEKLQPVRPWHRQSTPPSMQVTLASTSFGRQQFFELRLASVSETDLHLPTLAVLTANWRVLIPARLQNEVFTIKPGFTQVIRLEWNQLVREGIWQRRGAEEGNYTWPAPKDADHEFIQLQIGTLRTRHVAALIPGSLVKETEGATAEPRTLWPLVVPPLSAEALTFGKVRSSELFYNQVPSPFSWKSELALGQKWTPDKNQLACFALDVEDPLDPAHVTAFQDILARLENHQSDDTGKKVGEIIGDSERLPAMYHVAVMSTMMRRAHEVGDALSPAIRNQIIWRSGLSALKRANKIPIGVRLSLLRSATYASLSIPTDQAGWLESRRELTRLWLASLRQIHDAMDPNWDPAPDNAPSISGRADLLESYSVQHQGRRVLERAVPAAEELICQLYIRPAVRLQQLSDTLGEFRPRHAPQDKEMAERLIWTTRQMVSLFPDGYVPDAKLGLLQSAISELDDVHLPVLHALVTDDRTVHGIRTETVYGIGMKGHPSSLPALEQFVKRPDIKGNPLEYARAHVVALQEVRQQDTSPPEKEGVNEAPEVDPQTSILDRRVNLVAKDVRLADVLAALEKEAETPIELDAVRLKIGKRSLDRAITLQLSNERMESALQRLMLALRDLHVHFMVDQGKIFISTIEGLQQRVAARLPEWLRPFHGNGLLARLDGDGAVVEITASSSIDDDLVGQLKKLPHLKVLHIEVSERVTGESLKHIGMMPALESLELYSIPIPLPDESLVHLKNLATLRALSLTECKIGDAGVAHLAEMTQLRELRLGGNRLTDAGIARLKRLTNLEVLEIGHTNWVDSAMKITDAGLEHVGGFTQLRELDIGKLGVTDDGFAHLAPLRELRTLRLGGTQITGAGMRHIVNFSELESLSLGGTWIRDAALEYAAACQKLKMLHLSYTRIGDEGFRHLAKLTDLQHLSIDSRYVTDAGMAHLATLERLSHLALRASHVTDASLEHISKVKSLTSLQLSGSGEPGVNIGRNFTGTGYAHLAKLPNLAKLRLNNADVRWTELRSLKQLNSLHLFMPTMSPDDVRQLQKALPDTYVGAAWGGTSVMPMQQQQRPPNKEPDLDLPQDIESARWVPASEGIEYRIRFAKRAWRANEIPLFLLDIRNRGTRHDVCVELHQTQQRLLIDGQELQKDEPWGGAERLPPDGEPLTIPFTLCDWATSKELKKPYSFEHGTHRVQFQIHFPTYAPKGSREKAGAPFDLVTRPVEFEFVRVNEQDNATQTALDNLRRELIAFPRIHTPFISPTLKRIVREQLPQSSALLVEILQADDTTLHWPAAITFANFWERVPHKHIETYLKTALSHTIALRDEYPQGVDAAVALGYAFRASYLGMPADEAYTLETTTTHYLDGHMCEEPATYTSARHGLGATTGWIRLKDLPEGPHRIHLVTDYTFTRGEFTCSGQVESQPYSFTIVSAETVDHLRAPDDADITRVVLESFKFAESKEELDSLDDWNRTRFNPSLGVAVERNWRPQMRMNPKSGQPIALHMPVWKVMHSLPVDLCFQVEIHLDDTILDGGELVVLKGQTPESYISPRNSAALRTIARNRNEQGQVLASIVLKPSRAIALSNPNITRYYAGEIREKLRIFVNGATPETANLSPATGGNDVSWGKPVDGLAIGLISSRSKPLGNDVPELLAFFRNKSDHDQQVVRSSGFFALELNEKLYGPFNINGQATGLAAGERLGPVTIEPAMLRAVASLEAGLQPEAGAAPPRLDQGNNTLRVIYWHGNKKHVYSGVIHLKREP